MPLKSAFLFYLKHWRKERIFEPKQIQCMWIQVKFRESAKLQSRRTGKTDGNVWVMVFNALYFPAHSGISGYFTNTEDQLREVQRELMLHPLVKRVNMNTYQVCDRTIIINPLTFNTAQSSTFDHVLFDECGGMIGKEEHIRNALITSRNHKYSRVSYVGTPWYCSPFEPIFFRLKTMGQAGVFKYTDVEGDWLDKESIETDKLSMSDWQWRMMYLCEWDVPSGKIFRNIEVDFDESHYPPTQQFGCDQGTGEDHLVGITIKDDVLYVTEEHGLNFVYNRDGWNQYIGRQIEIESNGFNSDANKRPDATADDMIRFLGSKCQKVYIDDAWRSRRVNAALHFSKIVINPKKTPNVYNDLRSAMYQPGTDWYWKDSTEKKWTVHWLEAFLHALGVKVSSAITFRKLTEINKDPLDEYRKVY